MKSLSRRLFSIQNGAWVFISLHLPVSPAFPTHYTSLSSLGTSTPALLLPCSPYISHVPKRWSNSIHITLFILSGFGNHRWPAYKEVCRSFSCSLRVCSQGRAAHVAQAAGTATAEMTLYIYLTLVTLWCPQTWSLYVCPNCKDFFVSLRIIILISDKFSPILHNLKDTQQRGRQGQQRAGRDTKL